jgi:pimeloyl-ACP methyl ester carboxylesterase
VITRHYIEVNGRRVHYRKAGSGAPLLMAHQSPRSSAEYEPLMREWAEHFTCIAPDTPGFGQSDPLPGNPEIDDFADAVPQFLDALGLERVGAYGFHSGGIILASAVRRHPQRFTALAVGGYAIWTEEERRIFGEHYLPPFRPSGYGEHLTWLWNRILEQSWYFPWFDARDAARLKAAHDDPGKVDAVIRDMLDSGDAYRAGYGAVLRARRDVPGKGEPTCPVLITAYDGDPLQAHLERLGPLPDGWTAAAVATARDQQRLSLEHLKRTPAPRARSIRESQDSGFVRLQSEAFDGLVHWRGRPGAQLLIQGPGRSIDLIERYEGICIDLPGHGLTESWPSDAPLDWAPWQELISVAARHFDCSKVDFEPLPNGDPERLYPDLSPDRFGAYLTKAWSIVRAQHMFSPWYDVSAASAVPFDPEALRPERLAKEHRALLRAGSARDYLIARRSAGGGECNGAEGRDAAARAA